MLAPIAYRPGALAAALILATACAANDAPASIDFRRDVVPILSTHCFKCHQGRNASAGLRLDLKSELLGENVGVTHYLIWAKPGYTLEVGVKDGKAKAVREWFLNFSPAHAAKIWRLDSERSS